MGDLNLVENGVGQNLLENFKSEIKKDSDSFEEPISFTIATGELAYNIFKSKVIPVLNKINNLSVNLISVKNDFMVIW